MEYALFDLYQGTMEIQHMTSPLLLLNAIAITVPVVFHFQPDSSADQSVQARQQWAAQLAVMPRTPESPVAEQTADD